ncbi:cathepsin D-like [Planococcus citri]|uniref:cathepsin D-like n=1 Tax=Planococcus citri TaxID=170843 RepID=UPI0031F84D26
MKMKSFCLLLLTLFISIHHIRGDGSRIPLSIYENENEDDDNSVEFFGTISIGTPPQKVNVSFEISYYYGATHVLSNYCNTSLCRAQRPSAYNHKSSKTSRYENDFDRKFLEQPSGVFVTDNITIGNIQLQNESFLVATHSLYNNFFYHGRPFDGRVGLNNNTFGLENHYIEHCKNLGLKKKFSLYTNYPWNNDTSELMLCGEDNTKFRGNLQYVTLIFGVITIPWHVAIQSVSLHQKDKSFPIVEFLGRYFTLDPSLPYIQGPEQDIEKIYKALKATASENKKLKQVDCKTIHSLPNITFGTADNNFILTGNDYIRQLTENDQRICIVRLIPHRDISNSLWTIGNVFNRKFYTVFDVEMKRIGFAESIHDGTA